MEQTRNKHILRLAQAAMIAALYIVLTFIANLLGIASGAVQIRFSEALTILPYFTVSAVPGLTVGCLLANILTGCALPDIIFGTLATLLGAVFTRLLRKYKWLAPVPPILANALIIPPGSLLCLWGKAHLVFPCNSNCRRDHFLRCSRNAPTVCPAKICFCPF